MSCNHYSIFPIIFNIFHVVLTYNRWAPDEPNNAGGAEYYIGFSYEVSPPNGYNDMHESDQYANYLCEQYRP